MISEGRSATFTITSDGAVNTPTTLSYLIIGDTLDGIVTAATPNSDFTPTTGTIDFAPGDATKSVIIDILNDGTTEGLEGIKFELFDENLTMIGSKTLAISEGLF